MGIFPIRKRKIIDLRPKTKEKEIIAKNRKLRKLKLKKTP